MLKIITQLFLGCPMVILKKLLLLLFLLESLRQLIYTFPDHFLGDSSDNALNNTTKIESEITPELFLGIPPKMSSRYPSRNLRRNWIEKILRSSSDIFFRNSYGNCFEIPPALSFGNLSHKFRKFPVIFFRKFPPTIYLKVSATIS